MTRITLKPLAEQVLVVTGASSGIGLVTARGAAKAGARVMLIARNGAVLAEIVRGIESKGGIASYYVADVGEPAEMYAAAEAAVERFGRIDTWVNDAGVAIYAALADTPFADHKRLFRTNYFGVVNGSLAAVRHLRQAGGALITVGSIAGDMPSPVMGAYAASKHGVKGFVESLRIEIDAAGLPISVTLIKPSGMSTPIGEHALNCEDGEALVPPPVYAPELVADAILDAAQHPRRNVTVGGIGRLQVLIANHFPGLFARVGGGVIPFMIDHEHPKTTGDNLDAPAADGREHARLQSGRRFSVYGSPRRRIALAATAVIALAGSAYAASRRKS